MGGREGGREGGSGKREGGRKGKEEGREDSARFRAALHTSRARHFSSDLTICLFKKSKNDNKPLSPPSWEDHGTRWQFDSLCVRRARRARRPSAPQRRVKKQESVALRCHIGLAWPKNGELLRMQERFNFATLDLSKCDISSVWRVI